MARLFATCVSAGWRSRRWNLFATRKVQGSHKLRAVQGPSCALRETRSISGYSQFLVLQGHGIFLFSPRLPVRRPEILASNIPEQSGAISTCHFMPRISFLLIEAYTTRDWLKTFAFPFTRQCCSFCNDSPYMSSASIYLPPFINFCLRHSMKLLKPRWKSTTMLLLQDSFRKALSDISFLIFVYNLWRNK